MLTPVKAGSQCGNMTVGTYRHLQARLRNNAESVAFYGGVEKEGRLIVHKFKDLLRHHERLLKTQWQYGMVQVSSRLCSSSVHWLLVCTYQQLLTRG